MTWTLLVHLPQQSPFTSVAHTCTLTGPGLTAAHKRRQSPDMGRIIWRKARSPVCIKTRIFEKCEAIEGQWWYHSKDRRWFPIGEGQLWDLDPHTSRLTGINRILSMYGANDASCTSAGTTSCPTMEFCVVPYWPVRRLVHRKRRLGLFGHVARLRSDVPASKPDPTNLHQVEGRWAAFTGVETRLWSTIDHLDSPDLPRHGCNSDWGPTASGGPTVLANDRNGGRLRLNSSRHDDDDDEGR